MKISQTTNKRKLKKRQLKNYKEREVLGQRSAGIEERHSIEELQMYKANNWKKTFKTN